MQNYKQANRQNDGFHMCMFTQFKGYSFFQGGTHRMSRYSIFLMRFAFNSSIPVSLIHIKRQYGHGFNLHMYFMSPSSFVINIC